MKVLIIGGSGNISTAITRYLVERGEAVTTFSRSSRAVEKTLQTNHLIGDRTDFPRFEIDIRLVDENAIP